ncbi:MAG: phosphatidylserine decarboxylase [Gemmatimonadota bacterium]|nr:phosphatidylserine decarboxylase [Gemmatimonadota bacterium]
MIAAALLVVLALVAAFAWWRFQFFHRNPARVIPAGEELLASADGRILYVEDVSLGGAPANAYHQRVESAFAVDGDWTVVATYLSIFDAHFVRAPVGGRVKFHHMAPVGNNASMGESFLFAALRRPLPVGRRGYLEKNEFLGVSFEGGPKVLMVLMADWWIDQIVTMVGDGDVVARGQVIGKIQMGSQVDLWVPKGSLHSPLSVGDVTRAGETIFR